MLLDVIVDGGEVQPSAAIRAIRCRIHAALLPVIGGPPDGLPPSGM
jgi:hypothetical protein